MAELKSSSSSPKGIRRVITPVHTWASLVAGWLLFAIFITGTLSVFDAPLSRWLNPELHQLEPVDTSDQATRLDIVEKGQQFFRQHAAESGFWGLGLPDEHQPAATLFWEGSEGKLETAYLNPHTGELVGEQSNRRTEGGHHFVHTHFELHAGEMGVWIVGAVTMLMLLSLVSGIIIHKRIFKDFFTLRFNKGQRSWLDAHTLLAVLTLPFLLMIAYSGLAIQSKTYFEPAITQHYDNRFGFFTDLMQEPAFKTPTGESAQTGDWATMFKQAEAKLGEPANFINTERPADRSAVVHVFGQPADSSDQQVLHYGGGRIQFDGISGEIAHTRLPDAAMNTTAHAAEIVLERMHMAEFGGLGYRWLLFILGLTGAVMMAAGTILFHVKRRQSATQEFGRFTPQIYWLIEKLNIAAISGLIVACLGFFWLNRLLPLDLNNRAGWEVTGFFIVWLLTLLHAFCRTTARASIEQCYLIAWLGLLLPMLNMATTGDHLIAYLDERAWAELSVEIGAIVTGALGWSIGHWLQRRQRISASTSQHTMMETE